MTDREQARRDALRLWDQVWNSEPELLLARAVARACLDLLEELGRAERERDDWRGFAESNLEAIKRLEARV